MKNCFDKEAFSRCMDAREDLLTCGFDGTVSLLDGLLLCGLSRQFFAEFTHDIMEDKFINFKEDLLC